MRVFLLAIFLVPSCLISHAQEKKISLEINYGIAGNHFVTSYEENNLPEGFIYLANKNFLGAVGQVQLNYYFQNETSLSIGYSRDTHQKERSYQTLVNSVPVIIDNWSIVHHNNIFQAKHKRHINKEFKYHFGIFYLRPEQQEIEINEPPYPIIGVFLDERDNPNNNLNEAGILGGLNYEKKIDTKFIGGINITGYYLASTSTYETTYLTGSLAYQFGK